VGEIAAGTGGMIPVGGRGAVLVVAMIVTNGAGMGVVAGGVRATDF